MWRFVPVVLSGVLCLTPAYGGTCEYLMNGVHSADTNTDGHISLSELLRVIQLYNAQDYHPETGTEDGFAPGLCEGDGYQLVRVPYGEPFVLPPDSGSDTYYFTDGATGQGWSVLRSTLESMINAFTPLNTGSGWSRCGAGGCQTFWVQMSGVLHFEVFAGQGSGLNLGVNFNSLEPQQFLAEPLPDGETIVGVQLTLVKGDSCAQEDSVNVYADPFMDRGDNINTVFFTGLSAVDCNTKDPAPIDYLNFTADSQFAFKFISIRRDLNRAYPYSRYYHYLTVKPEKMFVSLNRQTVFHYSAPTGRWSAN